MSPTAERPPGGSSRDSLLDLFATAVRAAAPENIVAHLPAAPAGRVIVLGAGKASAAMAAAVEGAWPEADIRGLVITRYGHGVDCRRIEVVEAGHPVPDAAGLAATERLLALAQSASVDDLVLALISGGGSALLVKPIAGLSLADKQEITRQLLASGAPIQDINTVRKHLSAVKGGRLARAAAPAEVMTFVMSDVTGDDPALVASGPTLPDTSCATAACAILDRYGIAVPSALRGTGSAPADLARPGRPTHVALVAQPRLSLDAAAARARALGLRPVILGDGIEGEARVVASDMAAVVRAHLCDATAAGPRVLISGGETSVTLRGAGRGGRNTEFLLALALALDGFPGIAAIACDTDGIDGSEDNAGAVIDGTTLIRARALGLDPKGFLDANDSYGFFARLGDLVVTGPTRTNVNDFRAIFVEGRTDLQALAPGLGDSRAK